MEPTVKKEEGRYAISMEEVNAACKKVRSNKGAGGIDGPAFGGRKGLTRTEKVCCTNCGTGCQVAVIFRRQPEKLSYPKLVVESGD